MKIRKAVIPVAGKGTRFLPATKQIPKEMIPILDIPMIHYVVKEAADAGVEQIVLVNGYGKQSIEDYFDFNKELEKFLEDNGKEHELKLVREIGNLVDIVSIRQKQQLGLGHAVLCAEKVIGDEAFAVILGDDIVMARTPVTKQLASVFQREGARGVVGVMEIDPKLTHKYGVVAGEFLAGDNRTLLMEKMVEKPAPENAPSNLATPGRYIFSSEIFECLHRIKPGVGGEYQLTDAIQELAKRGKVFAHLFEGRRYDTGSLPGYIEAIVDFAFERPDTRDVIRSIVTKAYKEKVERS
jgi:UTP--glucose-1-phosphate uridylyltransferase